MRLDEALRMAARTLDGHSGSPRLDAALILAHVLRRPREYLIAHGEEPLSAEQGGAFAKLLSLRVAGMPIAYILGARPFYDREFRLTSHVLIPRPETEHVVEAALSWAAGRPGPLWVVDVGTGSGVIGVSVAAHLPAAQVVATDVSFPALQIAQINGEGLPNLHFAQSDLLSALSGPFDIIAANLPYIATADLSVLDVAKFEPHIALDGGPDGLVLIRRLLAQAPTRLRRPGLVLLEMGADQGAAVAALGRAAFPAADVRVLKDLAGLDRVVRIAVD
jgi:release factor glutamine methyltransferase